MIDLSIIIVNYKTPELIAVCVESIYKFVNGIAFEIIVVNNASKANDEEFIKKRFPEIRWIETGYNAGFGRANNVGMKNAAGAYFLLLNSDTVIIDDTIQKSLKRYKSAGDIAVAGAKQLTPNLEAKPIVHSFTSILRYSWILFPHEKADKFINKLIPERSYNDPEEVDYVVGAYMILRKDLFDKTGGFDEELFMYGEDCDWCSRLASFGRMVVFNNCQFIHDEWGSSPERREQQQSKITYFNRFDLQSQLSNLVWIRKHYGWWYYLGLMLHYWLWVPVFYLIKITANVVKGENPFQNFEAQNRFFGMIQHFSRFFIPTLFKKSAFYKISSDKTDNQ